MNISTKLKGLVAACVAAVGITACAETDGVQLWEGGPIWATSNLGESEVAEHPEYGALYGFEDAAAAVAKLGNRWRLPTKDYFDKCSTSDFD